MADEGFHEIQLTGKWLIFLSMTATVILVVVFLTGVMVGRGVRTQKEATTEVVTTADAAQVTPSPAAAPSAPPVMASVPPTPAEEDLTFSDRLEDADGKAKPASKPVEPARNAKATSTPTPTAAPAAPPAKTSAAGTPNTAQPSAPPKPAATSKSGNAPAAAMAEADPPGPGYVVKVAALRERPKAEALVKKLSGSGYRAYLVPLTLKGNQWFSVRVGKYPTKKEAEAAKRRLQKEERAKPSISH